MLVNYRKILIAAVIIAAGCSCVRADDANNPVKFGISADYFGKYIWRGQNLTNGSVFQPSISVNAYGFTGSVWGNQDWTSVNDHSGEFTEFDYALDYSSAMPGLSGVNYSVGVVHYVFPGTLFKPTTEVYGGLSFDLPLTPYIRIYHDVQEINGSYLQVGLGHTIEKIARFSETCYCGLQLGTSFGYGTDNYNEGYFGVGGGRFNDWTTSVGLPICLGKWTVKPSINYSMMLDDKIRQATAKSDNLWFGAGISRSF